MKHKLLIAAATAAMLAPTLAVAQDSGVYLRGQAGYGLIDDAEFTADIPGNPLTTDGLLGDVAGPGDLAYSLGVGYDFGNNWRVELDGSSLFTDFGTINGAPSTGAKINADQVFFNVLYDFDDFGRFEPYIGAGVGYSRGDVSAFAHDFLSPVVDMDDTNDVIRNPTCLSAGLSDDFGRSCQVTETDSNLAWNLIFGLGYEITPKLHWVTDYRYYDLGDYNLSGRIDVFDGTGAQVPPTTTLITDLEDVTGHSLMTGFRYRFGESTPEPVAVVPVAPTPPPPPAMVMCWDRSEVTDLALCPPEPQPEPTTFTCEGSGQVVTDLAFCPPRTECPDGSIVYGPAEFCPTRTGETIASLCGQEFRQEIIYYEFDRGQSAETRNTINRILDIGQFCQVDNIRVVGHTDTSGSAAYNLNLSRKRASDAVDELVRQGINRAVISSEGKGETEPFVQTGDGVKEQLNRRTEVLIQLSDVGMRSLSN